MNSRNLSLGLLCWLSASGFGADACKKSPAEWRDTLGSIFPFVAKALGNPVSYTPTKVVVGKIEETLRCPPADLTKEARECIEPTIRLLRYLALTGRLSKPDDGGPRFGYNEVFPKGWDGPSYIAGSSDEVKGATKTYAPGPWTLGFGRGDKDYLEATARFTEVPAEFRAPEFLDNLKSIDALSKAEAYLVSLNESRLKAGKDPILFSTYDPVAADNPMTRMTLYYPGNPARWLGVTIGEDPTFSVVAVEKKEVSKEAKLHTYFRDHKKTHRGGHGTLFSPDSAVFPTACRDCHKSGPLLPHAKEATIRKGRTEDYEKMREIMGAYPPTEFGDEPGPDNPLAGFGDPADKGKIRPLLKRCVENELRLRGKSSKDYFSGDNLQTEIVASSLKKMEAAYNCTSCHDGATRGPLVPPFGASFSRYLASGLMPPHNKLTPAERKLFSDCAEDIFLSTMDGQTPLLLQQLRAGCPEDSSKDSSSKTTPPEKLGEFPEHD